MGRVSGGADKAQFTYDFGIAVAQSTVNKMVRLTGATLTLASAYYALMQTSTKYVSVLKENALRFGGYLNTIKAMQQAQDRLVKGISNFDVEDQLSGLNRLMSVGIDVRKNFDLINKGAHALGTNFSTFSTAIANGIQGNLSQLVDMGMLTQRAARMFERYPANTIMRQQAIIRFVQQHKGLQNLIKNDFYTIQDQMKRLRGVWQTFLKSIVGKPNDPGSFYGQVMITFKDIADAFARNIDIIKRAGFVVGQVVGWLIRQIGKFAIWVGGQIKKAVEGARLLSQNYKEATYSLIAWLEFWKLHLVDLFNQYEGAIKGIIKLVIAYKALKWVFFISEGAIASVKRYAAAVALLNATAIRFGKIYGKGKVFSWIWILLPSWFRRGLSRISKHWISFTGFLRRTLKKAKIFDPLLAGFDKGKGLLGKIGGLLKGLIPVIGKIAGKFLSVLGVVTSTWWAVKKLFSWSEDMTAALNDFEDAFKGVLGSLYNAAIYVWAWIKNGATSFSNWWTKNITETIWNPIKEKFMRDMAPFFKSVGESLKKWIVEPLDKIWTYIKKFFSGIGAINRLLGFVFKKTVDDTNQAMINSVKDIDPELAAKMYQPRNPVYSMGNIPISGNSSFVPVPAWQRKDVSVNPALTGEQQTSTPKNPITDINKEDFNLDDMDFSPADVTFQNGAVQIIVQKGENIDEYKLKNIILDTIRNMQRDAKVRNGL